MRTMPLGKTELMAPVAAVGCMRLKDIDEKAAETLVETALTAGANFFDHADVYGQGVCETLFAKAMVSLGVHRENVILQSKCGIVRGVNGKGRMFDFSKPHILESVDGSLSRLDTDYLDVLLLHRPDALMEPEEVADAFHQLHSQGKVRHFGVSNHTPGQIRLLQKYLDLPIVANQLQFGIGHQPMVLSGLHMNMLDDAAVDRDGGILDFCRLEDITIQPWSPLQYGFFEGVFLGNAKFPQLNAQLDELAEKYGASSLTIAMAWILRHPARMQPVTGTTNPGRLLDCLKATDVTLTREEWYAVYQAAGHTLP